MGRSLSVDTSEVDDAVLVSMGGEIDLSTAPQFERVLGQSLETQGNVVVDLSNVDFMDSTGIGVLVRASNRAKEDGVRMTLVCGEGSVRRVLEVSGLDKLIDVFPDVNAATQG